MYDTLNIQLHKKKLLVRAIDCLGFIPPLTAKLGISSDEIKDIILTESTTDILDIEFHKKRLVLAALNSNPLFKDAAKSLGISDRGLYRMIDAYDIEKVKEGNKVEYRPIAEKNKKQIA